MNQFGCFRLGLGARCGVRIFIDGNQDMARTTLLGLPELRGVGRVVLRHRLLVHGNARCHARDVQHQMLGANLLWLGEFGLVGRVILLHVGGRHLDLRRHRGSRQIRPGDLALLRHQAGNLRQRGIRGEGRERNRTGNGLEHEGLAQFIFKLGRRAAVLAQHRLIALLRKCAVLLEGRNLPQYRCNIRIRRQEPELLRFQQERLTLDHAIEHLFAKVGCFGDGGIKRGAERLAHAVTLRLDFPRQFLTRNPHIPDLGDLAAAFVTRHVGIHAEQGEGNNNQGQYDFGQPALCMPADCFEHGLLLRKKSPARIFAHFASRVSPCCDEKTLYEMKKGELAFAF